MFGYEFLSIILEKSTFNQVTGYELTSPLWLQVDFQPRVQVDLVTSPSGYRLTRNHNIRTICGTKTLDLALLP